MSLNKDISKKHEEYLAKAYKGQVSPSSGASIREKGDIRTPEYLIEAKCRGNIGKPVSSSLVKLMEKIYQEAIEVEKEPVVALRFFSPESILADENGWVDLAVHMVRYDRFRIRD